MNNNPLFALKELGQSIWLDDIHRGMLNNGVFENYIEQDGISGVTSNPAILKNAIVDRNDYDDAIAELKESAIDARGAYEQLVIEDLQRAADFLRPVYDETAAVDGYVSLEVSPHYAYDTEATVSAARRLWKLLDRPNIMIKVPATREGIPAVRSLISEGININITLIFSLSRYRDVAKAFIDGLNDRLKAGKPVDSIASVASFFMSRIDVLIDKQLDALAEQDKEKAKDIAVVRGEIAIVSAKLAYQHYKRTFTSSAWQPFAKAGAQTQRLLWASTSTKDPSFSKVKYIDSLIAPDTVNTVPQKTIKAYRDEGQPALRLEQNPEEAIAMLSLLAKLGIDLGASTQQLEDEGLKKFVKPFDLLLDTLKERLEITSAP